MDRTQVNPGGLIAQDVQLKDISVITTNAAIADAKSMAGLLKSQTGLCRLVATLRIATPDKILWFGCQVQSFPTDQDAVNYLLLMLG